jgi:hypothetical protein
LSAEFVPNHSGRARNVQNPRCLARYAVATYASLAGDRNDPTAIDSEHLRIAAEVASKASRQLRRVRARGLILLLTVALCVVVILFALAQIILLLAQ